MSTLKRAFEIANEAHKGQVDKSGMPYTGHIYRVMNAGRTEDEKIAGVLHDLIEDTSWTFQQLTEAGFSDNIVDALRCLTKTNEEENYDAFIERVKTNSIARAVKINDLSDNLDIRRLSNLTGRDVNRLNKYLKAYRELTKPT